MALRARKNLSHEVLASKATNVAPAGIKISAKTIGNIESDRHNVTLSKLIAVALALEVEVWQLFMPPPDDPQLLRDFCAAIGRLNANDQAHILELIKKIPSDPSTRSEDDRLPNADSRRLTA